MDVVPRLALQRHLRNFEKAAAARCWDCCYFSAPHRGGPERALPNIWNNGTVFPVFKCDLVSRSPLFLLRVLSAVREGLADLLVRAAGITKLLADREFRRCRRAQMRGGSWCLVGTSSA